MLGLCGKATVDKGNNTMKKKIAVIGAGLQAKRRLPSMVEGGEYEVVDIVDIIPERAQTLAQQYGATASTDWRTVVTREEIDVVVVLTPPNSHAEISIAAMQAGKDVLCEKPLALTVKEAQDMVAVATKTKRILKCGFNHRHHPAVAEAYRLFKAGAIGRPLFGRSKYGIGGRNGIEKEWRSDPAQTPGGQLIDQGIHVIDLYRWFLGDVAEATGMVTTSLWPIAPLEDNGFGIVKTQGGVLASLHSSLTQWINVFEFEIYGDKGSLTVQNLGGGYGTEKLIVSEHQPDAPFSYHTTEYRGGDISWKKEWEEFTRAVMSRQEPLGNGVDGLKAMQVVNAIYAASASGQTQKLT